MTVDELLDQIDDMLETGLSFPFSGGKRVVDADRIQEIIDDVRLNLPQEIRQAKNILADRAEILAGARREGENIVRTAEERARAMVANEEIVKQAQQKATDMLGQAQLKSREMRKVASDYVDDLMRRTDEMLTANMQNLREISKKNDDMLTQNIAELRRARQSIRASKPMKGRGKSE